MSEKIKKLDEQLKKIKEAKKKALEKEKERIIFEMLSKTYGKNYKKFSEIVLQENSKIEVFINGEKLEIN